MAQAQMAPVATAAVSLRLDLAVLAAGTSVEWASRAHLLGCDVTPDLVAIDTQLTEASLVPVQHFAIELALWGRLNPQTTTEVRVAHALAAARATDAFINLHPRAEAEAMRSDLPIALIRLMAAASKPTSPDDLAQVLEASDIVDGAALVAKDSWRLFSQLRPIALPAQALMLEAGDNRLDLDPETGCNKYGGSPFPRANVTEFSSSTASDVSTEALAEAEALRRKLMAAIAQGDGKLATRIAAETIKADLLKAMGMENDDTVVPLLAASGTTAMLFATHIALAGDGRPALTLIVGPDETGRGVPCAITGRHAAPCTPTGAVVMQNEVVNGFPEGMKIERLAIRNSQGRPIPPDTLAEPIAGVIARERAAGRRVILHVLEGSKTGLVAPGVNAVLALKRWFPDLAVVVDACQLRTGVAVLRRYLSAGCMVAVSGSKFMGGPPFSGALLVPNGVFDTMAALPAGMADYAWRSDWPVAMDQDDHRLDVLPETSNPGLLLRWRGALAEMSAFNTMGMTKVAGLLDEIGRTVRAALLSSPALAQLPAMPAIGADSESWAARPSIFTFAVQGADGRWLDEAGLRRLHIQLASDVSKRLPANASSEDFRLAAKVCHIGQPVAFPGGIYPAGLRISVGARRIVAALQPGGFDALRRELDDTLAKLRLLTQLAG
ncbi:MAG TPA: hypothetical protein VGG27_06215 [Magnetospirillaceae bacterium]